MRVNDDSLTPEALFDDYLTQWHEDKASPNRAMSFDAEPDKALFKKLLAGIVENSGHIESVIKTSLTHKWKIERMSPLLIAILACAIYELKYTPALNASIIVNEYVTLTGRFFELQEVGFVNGLLDALAKTLR